LAEGNHRLTELDSELRVVTEAMPSVRSVAVGFWIDGGSVVESDDQAGLAHLVEHMVFRGTERFASVEIDQIFDGMGADVNAATGKESTSVFSRVLDRHLERAMDVLSDMVWRPTWGDLEPEKEVVLEEIAMYEDDPQDKVFDVAGEAVFGSHPLGRAIIGRAEVVAGARRDDLATFHGGSFVAPRVVVAAAGSVDHDHLVSLVEAGRPATGANGAVRPAPPGLNGGSVRFVKKDTEQVHVCLGGPGISRDDERRFALRVLDNILGGTSSSRLFQAVRERRGLAYSVFSFNGLYAGAGQVGIYLGTRPDNLGDAMAVVGEELERFVAEPADAEELERSKENVKGRVVLSLESTTARMNRLGSAVLADMPILTVDEVIERIDSVTIEDMRALAAELFDAKRLSAGGIGPDEDAFRSALAPVSESLVAA
jgi:predicted Zn-dependent peptidase